MDNCVVKQSNRAVEFKNKVGIRVDKILTFYKNMGVDFKRVNLLGHGKIMQSLSKFLAQNGVHCDIYDDKFSEISHDSFGNRMLPSSEIIKIAKSSKASRAEVSCDGFVGFGVRDCENRTYSPLSSQARTIPQIRARDNALSIVSPGIPPHNLLAQTAPNLISEYDFFAPTMPKSVWISGTNGKTTTTQMCALLLREFGAQSGGNIGIPLCEMDCNAPLWVLETSSFMLHYTNLAKPDIYALLPIAPDHISWHGDFENYVASKLKPLTMMHADSSAIIPRIYADLPQVKVFKGKIYFYDSAESLANLFGIEANRINFKGAFLLDSILSLAITKLMVGKIDYDLMNAFKIDSHKIEKFLDAQGRVFVDDSKATNISATEEALKIYADKFIFLILGGDNKGVSLAPLVEILQHYRVKVFAIGKSENHIKELCDESHLKCEVCGDLQNAVAMIRGEFTDAKNQICLLSPACASLDQFKSYAERGDKFKECALSI